MTTLRAAPFSLDYNDAVIFKVKAGNSLGLSAFSSDSSVGAKIQDVPVQMAAPVEQVGLRTSTSLTVTIDELTLAAEYQGAPITSYLLEWRYTNSSGAWSSQTVTTPSAEVISGLLPNSQYDI